MAKDAPAGKKYADGLPEGIWGKIGVAVAPSDGQRVYALIEAEKGGLFRSDDGGDTWELVNAGHGLRQRAWYFSTLTVDPRNADVVWCPQVPLLKSIDGGKTFRPRQGAAPRRSSRHLDRSQEPPPHHRLQRRRRRRHAPTAAKPGIAPPLPICQFYHVSADTRMPYHVSGCMQDIGTAHPARATA